MPCVAKIGVFVEILITLMISKIPFFNITLMKFLIVYDSWRKLIKNQFDTTPTTLNFLYLLWIIKDNLLGNAYLTKNIKY